MEIIIFKEKTKKKRDINLGSKIGDKSLHDSENVIKKQLRKEQQNIHE